MSMTPEYYATYVPRFELVDADFVPEKLGLYYYLAAKRGGGTTHEEIAGLIIHGFAMVPNGAGVALCDLWKSARLNPKPHNDRIRDKYHDRCVNYIGKIGSVVVPYDSRISNGAQIRDVMNMKIIMDKVVNALEASLSEKDSYLRRYVVQENMHNMQKEIYSSGHVGTRDFRVFVKDDKLELRFSSVTCNGSRGGESAVSINLTQFINEDVFSFNIPGDVMEVMSTFYGYEWAYNGLVKQNAVLQSIKEAKN